MEIASYGGPLAGLNLCTAYFALNNAYATINHEAGDLVPASVVRPNT